MKKRRKLVLLAVVVGGPLLFLGCLLAYLKLADLSGWRDTVARLASDAMGRELRIEGEFKPEIGFATRVHATDITLGNPEWSDDPHMVSVDSLSGEIDLWSIIAPPLTIRDIEITGARVLFESDEDGRFNWVFGSGDPKPSAKPTAGEFGMVIENARLEDVELAYSPAVGKPLQAALDRLEFTDDGTGVLDLDLRGTFEHSPLELSGRLGTLTGLINANTVEHDLEARLGETSLVSKGKINDLGSFTGVRGHASIDGTEFSDLTGVFGLESLIDGPFKATVSVDGADAGSAVEFEGSAGGIEARVTGTVDSLTSPGLVDVAVEASGPDVSLTGALTGIEGLPSEAFEITGRVRWEGFPISCDDVVIRVGDNRFTADGVLGEPPLLMGTDFTLSGGGPDLASIAAFAGLNLPHESFSVSGRLLRFDQGIRVDNVTALIGRASLDVNGTVGDPPDYEGTALTVKAEGPDLSRFQDLAGISLPAEAFQIDGKLAQGNDAIELEAVRARFGRNTFQVSGDIKTDSGFEGTDLRVKAEGPDASRLAEIVGEPSVPAEPFSLDGGIRVQRDGYRVHDLAATLGTLSVGGSGFIASGPELLGSDLQIHVEDSDLGHSAAIVGLPDLPHDAFSLDTRLRVDASGYRFDDVAATLAGIEIEGNGTVGTPPDFDGSRVQITSQGRRLSSLNPFLGIELPPAPFSLSGSAILDNGVYELDNVDLEVGGSRLMLGGTINPTDGFIGTDLDISASAPDLGRAGALAAGLTDLPELPAEPFTFDTRFSIDEAGYEIENLRATLGDAEARVNGRIGTAADFVGTDLTVVADGPEASLFETFAGVSVPSEPFKVRGHFRRTEDAYLFDRVAVELGGHSVRIHGSLGEAPRLIGTDLEIQASGDDTGLIAELSGVRALPAGPFSVSGRFHGTPEIFTVKELEIALGESDLEGSAEVDIRGKPAVTATVSSRHLDLRPYLKPPGGTGGDVSESDTEKQSKKNKKVFSDAPIDFSPLQRVDGKINITIDALQMPLKLFSDVTIDAGLDDGRLEVSRFEAVGQNEGHGSVAFVLEPDGDAYRLHAVLDLEALRFDLGGTDRVEPMARPPFDLSVDIEAVGRSPREFATSSNGEILMVASKGEMDNRALDAITADILLTLLKAFNPFAKDEAVTELECAVLLLEFADGFATLEPMVAQSDTMTMLGSGKVNLETEHLNLEWVTKPRKGIGISASMITNPYIKLGGTLGKPAIELKPMQAAASTGVAVATMGISLVAKGMLDRVTAEKKVCKIALEKIEARRNSPAK